MNTLASQMSALASFKTAQHEISNHIGSVGCQAGERSYGQHYRVSATSTYRLVKLPYGRRLHPIAEGGCALCIGNTLLSEERKRRSVVARDGGES